MNRTTTFLCSALLATALTWPAAAQTSVVPPTPASDSSALVAAAPAARAQAIIDFSSLYNETYQENLRLAQEMGENDPKMAQDSARVWTDELMPLEICYARDDEDWTKPIRREGQRFVLPNQPVGRHWYALRLTFVNGKGKYFAFNYMKPTLQEGTNNCLSLAKASLPQWKMSKTITFKLGDNFINNHPHFASGRATAHIDGYGENYPIDTKGCFSATLPFEETQDLHLIYTAGQKTGSFNFYLQNFENTPQGPNTIEVNEHNIAD